MEQRAAPRTNAGVGLFFSVPDSAQETVFGAGVAIQSFSLSLLQHGSSNRYSIFSPKRSLKATTEKVGEHVQAYGGDRDKVRIYDIEHLSEKLREFAFDVWHDVRADVLKPWELRQRCRTNHPITVTHHTISYHPMLHSWYLRLLLSDVRPYDSVICTSRAALRAIRELLSHVQSEFNRVYGTKLSFGGRFDVVPLGVDTDVFRPRDKADVRRQLGLPQDAVILLWLGRLSPSDKGDLLPLLKLFSRLVRETPDRNLRLICAGTELPEEGFGTILEAYAEELRISDHVLVKRPLTPDVPHLWYAAADVFVSPVENIQECFGLTPVEAMACGVPQVVADWSGYRETVLHEVTGFLVPTFWAPCFGEVSQASFLTDWRQVHLALAQSTVVDPVALHRSLKTLIDNKQLREEMGRQSRDRAVTNFSWRVVIRQYEELWRELSEISRGTDSQGPEDSWAYTQPPYGKAFSHYPSFTLEPSAHLRLTEEGEQVLEGKAGLPAYLENNWSFSLELAEGILGFLKERHDRKQATSLDQVVREFPGGGGADRVTRHSLWLMKYGFSEPDGKPLRLGEIGSLGEKICG